MIQKWKKRKSLKNDQDRNLDILKLVSVYAMRGNELSERNWYFSSCVFEKSSAWDLRDFIRGRKRDLFIYGLQFYSVVLVSGIWYMCIIYSFVFYFLL